MSIKAAVVDDHDLIRIAVEEILSRASDIDFVGSFTGVGTWLDAAQEVDVLLLGTRPHPDAPAVTARLREAYPEMRIILLGRQWTEASVRAALDCGAQGVLDRDEPLNDLLVPGIRRVARGKQFLSPEVAELVYTQSATNDQLTERELDVVLLKGKWVGRKEIAAALGIKQRSVYRLETSICRKWNLSSKDQIVPEAIRRGLIKAS